MPITIKTLLGSDALREAYPKVNENFEDIQREVNAIVSADANAEVGEAHVSTSRGVTYNTIDERFEAIEDDYVQKVTGKDLSDNNYDDAAVAEVAKIVGIESNITTIESDINTLELSLASIGDASPAGVYATLVALETAFPTGDTSIYVVSADGHWYYWNGSAWTDGGTYQATEVADGSVTTKKIANNAVTYRKTDFIEIESNNYFNKDTVIEDSSIDTITGEPTSSAGNNLSDFINVDPSTQYTIVATTRIAYYTELKEFISTTSLSNVTTTVTTPSDCSYIRIVVTGSTNLANAQVNLGSVALAYDNYVLNLNNNINNIKWQQRTRLGEALKVIIASTADYPNINLTNSTIVFPGTFIVIVGGKSYSVTDGVTIDYSSIYPGSGFGIAIYFNSSNNTFRVISSTLIKNVNDNEILFGTLSFGTGVPVLKDVNLPCRYKVNGLVQFVNYQESLLLTDYIRNTTKTPTFENGILTKVTYTDNTDFSVVREDTFTYTTSTITEVRRASPPTGSFVTLTHDLTTLETEVV